MRNLALETEDDFRKSAVSMSPDHTKRTPNHDKVTRMKYDETELVEFFGVLPSEQDSEEKEFFGTTIFDYHQNRYHLSVSYSIYWNDFSLYLKDIELEEPIVALQFERVEEIRIRRDKPTSVPVLIVGARDIVDGNEKQALIRTIQIGLEPSIGMRINNEFA